MPKAKRHWQTDENQTWELQEGFLTSDMDRLDHPDYFDAEFSCPELSSFFFSLSSLKQIKQSRGLLNQFFDRMITGQKLTSNRLYVRLKWLVFQHQIIQRLPGQSPLLPYILKGLMVYSEQLSALTKDEGPYQKYLVKTLLRPYLQYLSKLCTLAISDKQSQNELSPPSINHFEISHDSIPKDKPILKLIPVQNSSAVFGDIQNKSNSTVSQTGLSNSAAEKITKWYRTYNFITWAIDTFAQPLKNTKDFMEAQFPYLLSMNTLILKDLHAGLFTLKYQLRRLKNMSISLIEMGQLEDKLKSFNHQHRIKSKAADKIDIDYNHEDIKDFLCSPVGKVNKGHVNADCRQEQTCTSQH